MNVWMMVDGEMIEYLVVFELLRLCCVCSSLMLTLRYLQRH